MDCAFKRLTIKICILQVLNSVELLCCFNSWFLRLCMSGTEFFANNFFANRHSLSDIRWQASVLVVRLILTDPFKTWLFCLFFVANSMSVLTTSNLIEKWHNAVNNLALGTDLCSTVPGLFGSKPNLRLRNFSELLQLYSQNFYRF